MESQEKLWSAEKQGFVTTTPKCEDVEFRFTWRLLRILITLQKAVHNGAHALQPLMYACWLRLAGESRTGGRSSLLL